MKQPPNPLSQQLRELRKRADLTGAEVARRAELSQAKISRVETGTYLPTPEQVETLCRLYKAPTEQRRALVRQIRDIREATSSARVTLQRGGWQMQQRIGQLESASSLIRSYSPDTVIGLCQTERYIRAMLTPFLDGDDLDRTVSARLERHAVLDTAREFRLLMSEGALRWNLGGPEVMLEQLEHLDGFSRRENVQLGLIPWTTRTDLPGVHAFHVYDRTAVVVGTMTRTAIIPDSSDITDYLSWFERLERCASYGEDARDVLSRLAEDYRTLS